MFVFKDKEKPREKSIVNPPISLARGMSMLWTGDHIFLLSLVLSSSLRYGHLLTIISYVDGERQAIG